MLVLGQEIKHFTCLRCKARLFPLTSRAEHNAWHKRHDDPIQVVYCASGNHYYNLSAWMQFTPVSCQKHISRPPRKFTGHKLMQESIRAR